MRSFYKAVRPNGRDFFSNSVQWAPSQGESLIGITWIVKHERLHHGDHPVLRPESGAHGYLSVSALPTDCTGAAWPLRLLRVRPVEGYEWSDADDWDLPNKRVSLAWQTIDEIPAWRAFGRYGESVEYALKVMPTTPVGQVERLLASIPKDDPPVFRNADDLCRAMSCSAAYRMIRSETYDVLDAWQIKYDLPAMRRLLSPLRWMLMEKMFADFRFTDNQFTNWWNNNR